MDKTADDAAKRVNFIQEIKSSRVQAETEQMIALARSSGLLNPRSTSSVAEMNKIYLTGFIRNFLPVFKGLIKDEKELSYRLGAWVEFAGGYIHPVAVVEDGNASKILFVVPSFLQTKGFDPLAHAKQNRPGLAEAINQSRSLSVGIPERGDHFMNEHMHRVLAQIHTPGNVREEEIKEWKKIFDFCRDREKEMFLGMSQPVIDSINASMRNAANYDDPNPERNVQSSVDTPSNNTLSDDDFV